MKQLTQNLKSGAMDLLAVPFPALSRGAVLVRNHYSLISAGTEGSKVEVARSSLLAKAQAKPEQVKQVIESIKTEGLLATYGKVMNKLDFPSALGYSCAGEIIETGKDITDLHRGEWVACGGDAAVHAEVVAVPRNLCVKVPTTVKIEHAAYTTLAAIALQGIRQADLRLGESCAVIGLGLIGQLTMQMLKAAGITAYGIDIDEKMVDLAKTAGAEYGFVRNDETAEHTIRELSGGFGADAVIITAGTNSLDPVESAGRLCRHKGRVVIVGAVPTGFSREAYYKKELTLLMSCSYGPGRYNANYETKGLDYPIGYVRWTENRNMQAFIALLAGHKLNLDCLSTHVFEFSDAPRAYQMILDKPEPFCGVLLRYDPTRDMPARIEVDLPRQSAPDPRRPRIGFIGAGSFAQKYLLPTARRQGQLVGLATATGNSARNIVDKYGFSFATNRPEDIVENQEINTVFIATRHHLHAAAVLQALQHGKNVFVEKPLCLTEDELAAIKTAYDQNQVRLMVGFNRRFAPFIERTKKLIGSPGKKAIVYRINAGAAAADSWVQDHEIGGGRIIGEVCHFIDLAMYLTGERLADISAFAMEAAQGAQDTLTITLNFASGSIATIAYFANGSPRLEKEYLEINASGQTIVIRDFKEMHVYGKTRKKYTLFNQDKGHAREVELFLQSIQNGVTAPIPFADIYAATLATFKVVEAIRTKTIVTMPE
jgi:polar amino acid transport system substrate-binding protein